MKLSALFVAALAATAEALVQFTMSDVNVQAGKAFNLTWSGNVGPVTITLKNGPPTALVDVMVIDSNDSGSSFSWTPPATLPSDTYAFEIKDSVGPNYSAQFEFKGTASASVTTSTVSSTTSTTSSATLSTMTTTLNSTMTSTSRSSTRTSSSSSTTSRPSSTQTPANTNDGLRQQSPLALVLVTIAALLYFN